MVIIVFAGGATDSGASTEQTRTRENEICKITVTFILLPDNAAEDVPNTQQSTGAPPSGILHEAATDAEQIKSVRDRLGVSIAYLEGLLRISDLAKDMRRSLKIGLLADIKCCCRSTRPLVLPS